MPLPNRGAEIFDNAFSFSIPIEVYQLCQARSGGESTAAGAVAGGKSENVKCDAEVDSDDSQQTRSTTTSLFVQQQALKCMESDCSVLPI